MISASNFHEIHAGTLLLYRNSANELYYAVIEYQCGPKNNASGLLHLVWSPDNHNQGNIGYQVRVDNLKDFLISTGNNWSIL